MFSLIVFTFILTISLVILLLNRSVPHRSRVDEITFYFILVIGLHMVFLIGNIMALKMVRFLPMAFGYFYGPFLYLVLFTRSKEAIPRKKLFYHTLPFCIAILVYFYMLVSYRNDKELMRLIFSYLDIGSLVSITLYLFAGLILVSREGAENRLLNPSKRLWLIFWVVCLLAIFSWERSAFVTQGKIVGADTVSAGISTFMAGYLYIFTDNTFTGLKKKQRGQKGFDFTLKVKL